MTNEGTLNLDCIAADPKSEYLFGIASANTNPHTNYADSHIVLVRSNMSPTNLANITWSVVSSSTSSELSYNYPAFTSVDCVVSKEGDFTAFVRSPYRVFSEKTGVPMGVRYIRESETWSNIYGPAVYGWVSDAFVHKSFYAFNDLVHLVTGENARKVRTAILDTSTNSLRLASLSVEGLNGYRAYRETGTFEESVTFNYTRQGFFSQDRTRSSNIIATSGNEIYTTGLSSKFNEKFETFSYSRYVGVGNRVLGAFKGPPDAFYPHYVFGGLYRFSWEGVGESSTFFGSIGVMGDAYKLYTTVRDSDLKNQSYVEHTITRSDTAADFT
ncbi:hypothetical protein BGZ96_002203, partial [Linnemannia gamsii]